MAFLGNATQQFRVEADGYNLLGVAEVKLGSINFQSSDMEGAGIVGKIAQSLLGYTESIEVEVTFNTISQPAFNLLDISGKLIEFKSEVAGFDTSTGGADSQGVRIAVRGTTKGLDLGTLKLGDAMKVPFKLEASYIEIWSNGKSVLKIDKFNGIFLAAGKALIKKLDDLF